jgi:hypothetical protein
MNGMMKSTLGISVAGLFVLVATHGAAFFEVMQGAFAFLVTLAKDAPMGLSSFLLALALATASQPFLRHAVKTLRWPWVSDFLFEVAALVIGFGVMWGQLRTLSGALLGILAGLLAPLLFKAIKAIAELCWESMRGEGA